MRALWVHEALAKQHFVDPVSAERCFYMVLGARLTLGRGTCRPALLKRYGSMCWNAVVGRRAICLYFLVHLSP
jgi:hypothetical protein